MEWTVHGERSLYESPWVSLRLVDVEVPGGPRFDHHVVRTPRPAVGVVVTGPDGLLLLWRHRFISGTWGWEVPAGGVDDGESLEQAAAREVLEETGWAAGPLTHLVGYHPSNGLSSQRFELFSAAGAAYVGEPSDPGESSRVEWVPAARVRSLVAAGEVQDGMSLTALLWWACRG
ncbi:MAG: NUDIX hydrolase [Actinobacteria bacterium]|nr:NUDIX hydrolase [Actinomycetota bacterium]MCA1720652.1 NUDIX hydrolase [Actinomycetota bacterium]